MEKLPLLENIFHKIDLPFVEEGIYQEYVKQDFTNIGKILLFLVEKISNKRNRIIITLVMYDFIIKNTKFLIDYQRYAIATSNKFEELLLLPGVGRKTANVVLNCAFNHHTIAVDTHVFRVSARLALTKNAKTPLAAEKQLIKHIPADLVHKAHHWLILHGRYTCLARKPICSKCGLQQVCLYKGEKK